MKQKHVALLLLPLMLAVVLLSACEEAGGTTDGPSPASPTATSQPIAAPTTASTPEPTPAAVASGRQGAKVTRVIDGDTFEATVGGKKATIRLIGIDTPETVAPGQPVGCYGREASAYAKTLLEGKDVQLEKDVSETDRFQRLLRYAYLADGQMVNALLVQDGYAKAATFPPDVKYAERFAELEGWARDAGAGLWGKCVTPMPKPTIRAGCAFSELLCCISRCLHPAPAARLGLRRDRASAVRRAATGPASVRCRPGWAWVRVRVLLTVIGGPTSFGTWGVARRGRF